MEDPDYDNLYGSDSDDEICYRDDEDSEYTNNLYP